MLASNRRSKKMIRHSLPRLNIRLTLGYIKKGGNLYAYRIIENDTWHVQMTKIGMRKKGLFQ